MNSPIGTIDLDLGRTVELDEFQRFPQIGEGQNADDTYLDMLSRSGLVDRRDLDSAERQLHASETRLANGDYNDLDRDLAERVIKLDRERFEKVKARILAELPEVRALRQFGAIVAALEVPECQATESGKAFTRLIRRDLGEIAKRLLTVRAR